MYTLPQKTIQILTMWAHIKMGEISPSRSILTTFISRLAHSYRSLSILELWILAFFSSSVTSVPRHSPILSTHLLQVAGGPVPTGINPSLSELSACSQFLYNCGVLCRKAESTFGHHLSGVKPCASGFYAS